MSSYDNSAAYEKPVGSECLRTSKLKPDSENRPIWISDDGHIHLEMFSPFCQQAQDFLMAIAEPTSRPDHIHEYQITPYSLYAAVSVGMETEDIIDILEKLSKSYLTHGLISFIRSCTLSYGKVKLVLHQNAYRIETCFPDVLQFLLKDETIQRARVLKTNEGNTETVPYLLEKEDIYDKVYYFEILAECVEAVKRKCIELDYPMLEEYNFRNDMVNPTLDVHLKGSTVIRSYQEKSLSKIFGNGRSRSGIIVLPCGAGKTLVGIIATCTIKKNTLVLCTSAVAVEQWRQQYKYFTNIADKQIAVITSDIKEKFTDDAGVIVTTYTMIAYGGKRSLEAQKMIDFIRNIEWGLLILDEVHVVPANVFRKVLTTVAAHTKLGLTATLLREDNKISDLNFLIGPKLYESNWLDLAKQGHIAKVKCAEVWCPMTSEFYREYFKEKSRKRRLLYVMNPNKFQVCEYLLKLHEKKGDKIIVFSDNVYALKAYALKFKKPFIYGPTSQIERMRILHQFQSNPNLNTIFLSKVGDTSIDLPEATCLIQLSSHYGSRRQEAQRLGRILRAKRRSEDGFTAYFYSLVSKDTEEMYYSAKRQQFLIDQGYSFRVITDVLDQTSKKNMVYSTRQEQLELLKSIIVASDSEVIEDDSVPITDDIEGYLKRPTSVNRRQNPFSNEEDEETHRDANQKGMQSQVFGTNRHFLFKSRYKKSKREN